MSSLAGAMKMETSTAGLVKQRKMLDALLKANTELMEAAIREGSQVEAKRIIKLKPVPSKASEWPTLRVKSYSPVL